MASFSSNDVVVVVGVGGMGEAITRRISAGRTVLLADFNLELLARVAKNADRGRLHRGG